ncbi:TetR/AcrR family transcriptional regulator [Streptomyces griseorubiginosus]|uniref:TetR/AcrR family transcriptional regulator n=1 Tax=Streptomyces griseorubiginosus TaxID=67304 RepID=UPI002E81ADB2|nr:TetR/AcrR family transcriptional regulator [Streptomyces griseorubiginosus]WUB43701.1 TetR/AcrR family transcriptional regulator [Streptomyces griseorubiginosus]WUB52219.1 TetR/AcrR family transcriptional regulator [Streptomyces griseorubiginosus]
MADPKPSRRERLRAEAAQEIKTIALKHMAENGTAAVSLRAIAREMGMTAGAIYSYYDTRDDLITALIADVYNSLAQALEEAVAAASEGPVAQVMAYGQAYRSWAVANPQEFRLVYGDPAPDYQVPPCGPAAEAEHRACTALTGVVVTAWPWAQRLHADEHYTWDDYDPEFIKTVRSAFPDLHPAAVALAMRLWGRLHGLVSLEIYGHLRPQVQDPAKLYHAELVDLTHLLGLTAPVAAVGD